MNIKVINQTQEKEGDLVVRLVAGLHKIGLAMKSRPWRRTGLQGVGPLQSQVLTALHSKPDQSATVSTIARELSVKLPTASEVIRTLERKRLVRRRRTQADHRVVVVQLTAKGLREGRMMSGWPTLMEAATNHLSPAEKVSLLQSLVKLIRALQIEGEIPVARMCVSCQYFRPNIYASKEQPHHCQYIDAPFGNQSLRIDCQDYVAAPTTQAREAWEVFLQAPPA